VQDFSPELRPELEPVAALDSDPRPVRQDMVRFHPRHRAAPVWAGITPIGSRQCLIERDHSPTMEWLVGIQRFGLAPIPSTAPINSGENSCTRGLFDLV